MEYRIVYRNEQGVLLRVITAVTRRGITIEELSAAPGNNGLHIAVFRMEPTEKQEQQLRRDWNAVIGVEYVRMPRENVQAVSN